jgi:hypothetical protein
MSKKLQITLTKSSNNINKFMISINKGEGRTKTIHFGAKGYSDYTIHKDPERMKRYISRHKSKENWTKSGIDTKGFWSRWLLWSENNINKAIKKINQKFSLKIINKLSSKTPSVRKNSTKKKSPSRKKKSPSRKKKSPNRKKKSPSRKKKSPSRKKKSPSRKKKSPSRKKKSPSRKKKSPSRKK